MISLSECNQWTARRWQERKGILRAELTFDDKNRNPLPKSTNVLSVFRGNTHLVRMKALYVRALAGGLLFVSGCDVLQSARNDLDRLTSSNPFASRPTQAAVPAAKASTTVSPSRPSNAVGAAQKQAAKSEPPEANTPSSSINIIGKSEAEVRDLLGPPVTVEERPPGKIWRYREGRCTLEVQLYPDVETRQFGTLAYEVRSDDNTDEGNRACLAQLRSRTQSHG